MRHTRYDVFLMATALLLTLGLLAIWGVALSISALFLLLFPTRPEPCLVDQGP